jgi:hypothetical protein
VTVRRRLVVAFVLVAGLVTGALAISSYLLVAVATCGRFHPVLSP